jgi:predicted TIM-barrel fold metal-dependent hydrolase
MAAYFTDIHCHLFNIEDIPFHATLRRKVRPSDTLKLFVASLGLGNVDKYRNFILFFEQPVQANLSAFLDDLRNTLPGQKLLLIPLVMDFFDLNPATKPVAVQMSHLREGIAKCNSLLGNDRVLPFLGYDLRHFRTGSFEDFKRLWEEVGGITAIERRKSPESLKNGDVIGIKFYPPIGFNPDPSKERNAEARKRYQEFYRWCTDFQIPITVHCQYPSYSMHSSERVRYHTHPLNWEKVLKRQGLEKLRINFAHAGGWHDLAAWQHTGKKLSADIESRKPEYATGTWAPIIVSLLKTYPNTYADLSAFNFASTGACKALKKLLERDEQGKFGSGHFLRKKLLWGSDVPMIISEKVYNQNGKASYRYLYERFIRTISACAIDKPEEAIRDMTENNPAAFIFPEQV